MPNKHSNTTRELTAALRGAALLVAAMFVSACADRITAPQAIDGTLADRVLPSVEDAQLRVAPAIENLGVRGRVAYDLGEIVKALTARDAQNVRYHTRLAANILIDYRTGLGSVAADGPDVGAIALALHAVGQVVGSDFNIKAFK